LLKDRSWPNGDDLFVFHPDLLEDEPSDLLLLLRAGLGPGATELAEQLCSLVKVELPIFHPVLLEKHIRSELALPYDGDRSQSLR